MQTLTAQQAINTTNTITAQQVQNLLANKSVTFANIVYVTNVATAAAHKNVTIKKVTQANVQLFSNIKAATQVFANAVKRSAANIAANNTANVANFTQQSNYYTHTNCYSLVQHNTTAQLYLYAIFNSATSTYYINNVVATKQQVAQYLTASAAAKLLSNSSVVHNVANNVIHNVQVRTIALNNIVSITANKQTITNV